MSISKANINTMVALTLTGKKQEALELLDICILKPILKARVYVILQDIKPNSSQDLDQITECTVNKIMLALPKEEKPEAKTQNKSKEITVVASGSQDDFTEVLLCCREIWFKIMSHLQPKDIKSATCVSAEWCNECSDYADYIEVSAPGKYIKLLASNLDEHCSVQKQELLDLREAVVNYIEHGSKFVSDIQECFMLARGRIYNILRSLDEGDALLLKERLANEHVPLCFDGLLKCAGIDKEIEKANGLAEDQKKYRKLQTLCSNLTNIGDFEGAIEIAESLPEGDYKYLALQLICRKLAEIGNFTRAIEMAESLPPSYYQDMAYQSISTNLILHNKIEEAEGFAMKMSDDPERKSRTLFNVAFNYIQAGKWEKAKIVYDNMATTRNAVVISNKVSIYKRLCKALINMGKIEEALELFHQLDAVVYTAGYGSNKIEIGKIISGMLCNHVKILLENNAFDEAILIIPLIPRENERSYAFENAANKLFEMGQLKQAVQMACKCDSYTRDKTLEPILKAFMKNMASKEKEEVAGEVIAMIEACTDEGSKNSVLHFLAKEFAEKGEFNVAEELADQITDIEKKDKALYSIYKNMLVCGKIEYALDVIVKLAAPGFKSKMYAALKMILVDLDLGLMASPGLFNLMESPNFNRQDVANYMKACLEKPPLSSSTSS